MSADVTQQIAGLKMVRTEVQGLTKDYTALGALQQSETAATRKRSAAMTELGATAGKVGLVAAAGLGVAIYAAANFDQGMSNVQAATHETAANMSELRDAALQAGADTAFSATEAAAGIENLAKAGVSTTDILAGGLSGALDLAAAGGIGVAEAAETAATALTQFGLAGSDVPHVADLLAAAAGKAQGDVSDFAAALNQSGLVADQVGLSIEETTGGLAAFASAGLLGSDAGTGFKTMLGALTPNSAKAADEMDRLGISAYDSQGNFVGLAQFAGNLRGALKDMSDEQRQATLETIFGSDAVRAASVLYEQGESGVRKWIAAVNDQGYAAETAATKLDNLKGDVEALMGSLETAAIGTGEGSQGPLRSLVQGVTDVINAYNDLPDAAHGAVAGILGVTAITGGSLWFGAKVVQGVNNTRQALVDLGETAPRTAGALKALGTATVVVGGIIALDAAIDGLLDSMREAPPGIETMTGLLLDLAEGKTADLGKGFEDLGGSLDFFAKNEPSSAWTDWIPNITGLLPGENAVEQMDRLSGEFESLDAGLANLASSGHARKARQALDALTNGLSAGQKDTLLDQLPQYQDALAGVANEARLAGRAAKGMGDGTNFFAASAAAVTGVLPDFIGGVKDASSGLDKGATNAEKFSGALAELNGWLDKQAALRNYQAALDDFREGYQAAAGFNIDLDKGRQNEEKLHAIADAVGQVASHLKGLARTEFVDNAIGQLRAMAKSMNLPRDEVRDLIGELRTLDTTTAQPETRTKGTEETHRDLDGVRRHMQLVNALKAEPSVDVNGSPAFAAIEGVKAALRSIPDEHVNVFVNRIGGVTSSYGGHSVEGRAAGGAVRRDPRCPIELLSWRAAPARTTEDAA